MKIISPFFPGQSQGDVLRLSLFQTFTISGMVFFLIKSKPQQPT